MAIKKLTLDAVTLKGKFKPSTAAEREFSKALRKVAKVSGALIDHHVEADGITIHNTAEMQKELERYSKKIGPWATRQSAKLLQQVQKSNKKAYAEKSKLMGKLLNAEFAETEVGAVSMSLMVEQVALIQSIPTEAGLRAQKIAYEAVLSGTRAEANASIIDELKKQLGLTTKVAESRAKLIAITETARANASINQARAMKAGASQYRWHNSGDGAVRHSHLIYKGKPMQGQIFSWDKPPTLSDGMTGHPGTFPRCRCFAEPVFDDE